MNIRHSLLGLFLPLSLFSCHMVEKEADGRPLSSYVNPFVGASTNTELAGESWTWKNVSRGDSSFRYGAGQPQHDYRRRQRSRL